MKSDKKKLINPKILKENGYRYYYDNRTESAGYRGLYQKDIKDKVGIKYFINIKHYDFSQIDTVTLDHESFEIDINFTIGNEDHVSITLHGRKDHSLSEIEAWCERTWLTLQGKYYERN